MPFKMIVPEYKVKTGRFTVSCVAVRGGPFKLTLSMPHAMFVTWFGDVEKINIHEGEGADIGKLLMAGDNESGHFKPTFMKHTVIIRLPIRPWAPELAMAGQEVEYRQTKDGLLVTLPEWAWNKERQTAIKLARQQVQKETKIGAAR